MGKDNKMTGAEAVITALVENGVEVIFGYPGGAVLPLYDALFKNKINIIFKFWLAYFFFLCCDNIFKT